jgi:transcription-repair coupling factor (superfamily II helicase)
MRERELEEKMHSFLRGDADVLVSTTIIESGLDIPQANTLIVERADALGLAQLYQIRGRVGRSDVSATPTSSIRLARADPEARARLATLADQHELGAGFAIAMRDLEIRGAGRPARRRAVRVTSPRSASSSTSSCSPRRSPSSRASGAAARPVRVEASRRRLRAGAVHRGRGAEDRPASPLGADRDRGRAARAAGGDEDRYGPLPEPVENLFAIQEAKLKLARSGADYLVFRAEGDGRARCCSAPASSRAALGARHRRLHERPPRGFVEIR